MLREGAYYHALKKSLIRSYCAFERLNYDNYNDAFSKKLLANQQFIKTMRLIYVSVSLCPEFLQDLIKSEGGTVKLDQETLLRDIAAEAYQEESFNLGEHPGQPGEKIKMPFEQYVAMLEKLVQTFKYDDLLVSRGMRERRLEEPSPKEQRTYMEERLAEMQFDFMPKQENQLYHVVSAEWFANWKAYVGIVEESQD